MWNFSMFGGIQSHLDDMLASKYQLIDWTLLTTCQSSIPPIIENLAILHHRPTVHTRDREPVTQVV